MDKHTGRLSQAGMVVLAFVLAFYPAAVLAGEEATMPRHDGPSALDPFKKLVGKWQGTVTHHDGTVQDASVTYAVTAAGSAVMETMFCESADEMVTMFFMDGDHLTLTHYCAVGNQPTMVSQASDVPNKVVFEHSGGTNIASEDQPHMHHAEYHFVTDDHIVADWTFHVEGKPGGTAHLDLKRQ